MTRVAIAGAAGRMGLALIRALTQQSELQLTAALVADQCHSLGKDSGTLAGVAANNVECVTALDAATFDVLIDFSEVQAVPAHVRYCVEHARAMVVGVTGLESREEDALTVAGKTIPLVYAANMSIGVHTTMALVEHATRALPDSDIEIVETHHRDKKDAPSGTALRLGELAARVRKLSLDDCAVHDRTVRNLPRSSKDIGFASVRGGTSAGEHTVLFMMDGESLEISHRALDRSIFARGALRAATWVCSQKPGIYGMREVLGM